MQVALGCRPKCDRHWKQYACDLHGSDDLPVAELVLGDVHLQFVTNRGSLAIPKASIEASRKLDATK
jgi:hypothetical protein